VRVGRRQRWIVHARALRAKNGARRAAPARAHDGRGIAAGAEQRDTHLLARRALKLAIAAALLEAKNKLQTNNVSLEVDSRSLRLPIRQFLP
jgi:hypothetical protein